MSAGAIRVFDYPEGTHVRRHGPQGYLDYKHYKPWLRDEFSFRCVYCLCREIWFPDGDAYFGTDHVLAQSQTPQRLRSYDELVYACSMCNAWKKDFPVEMDFSALASATHLEGQPNGTLRGLTRLGEALIDVCALNRPDLVSFRRDMRMLLDLLARRGGEAADQLRRRYLGYPEDLPDLARLRPPGGNSRSEGIATSHFERRQRGELPYTY